MRNAFGGRRFESFPDNFNRPDFYSTFDAILRYFDTGGANLLATVTLHLPESTLTVIVNTASASGVALLAYGAGTPAELFNSLQIDAGATGTAIIIPTGINDSDESYVAYNSGGTSTSSRPVYKNVDLTAADTLVQLPPLTVIVAPVPEPATAAVIGLGATGLLTRRHRRATSFVRK